MGRFSIDLQIYLTLEYSITASFRDLGLLPIAVQDLIFLLGKDTYF